MDFPPVDKDISKQHCIPSYLVLRRLQFEYLYVLIVQWLLLLACFPFVKMTK
jgi:hypothetical protein